LPYVFKTHWKKPLNDTTLFLVFWTVLPFVFFSLSHTKLSHYILPVYPPLAILAGEAVAAGLKNAAASRKWPLWFPSFNLLLLFLVLLVGFFWPGILPRPLQEAVRNVLHDFSGILAVAAALGLIWVIFSARRNIACGQAPLYLLCCGGFALYFFMAQFIVKFIGLDLSSKILAEKSAPLIQAEDQLVIYDNYRSTLPYYLKITRPMWIVWRGKGASIMESYYIAEKQPQPSAAYGKALMTVDEFSRLKETTKKNLFVFVKTKSAATVTGKNNVPPRKLFDFNDCALLLITDSDDDPPK
jgi:4-amino-4-deoxy-L-arabinose transferase-like glycosyltransferase